MSRVTPETVRSELGQGRHAIAVMVNTAGWRFLARITPNRSYRPAALAAGPGRRKKFVVKTAWSLAGAKLYDVNNSRLAIDLRSLETDRHEFRTIDVLCAEATE